MTIPRKPSSSDKGIQTFIEGANPESLLHDWEKKGRRIISLSLLPQQVAWMDAMQKTINSKTARRVTRSEIGAASLSLLQSKSMEEIIQIIKNR